MSEAEQYKIDRITVQLEAARELVHDLRAKMAAMENDAEDSARMVPIYVHLPNAVYQRLRERAEENGQPAAELASLWLWRAIREWGPNGI